MSDQAPEWRAADAERLLNDALLKEAFEAYEKALVDRAIEAPARDDEARTRCLMAVQVLRKVRKHLKSVVYDGEKAAKAADDIATDPNKRRWL